jgi:predicted transcriptional regulator
MLAGMTADDLPEIPEEFADRADLEALREIAAKTGRSMAAMIREAIHKAALANRVWEDEPFFTAPSPGPARRRTPHSGEFTRRKAERKKATQLELMKVARRRRQSEAGSATDQPHSRSVADALASFLAREHLAPSTVEALLSHPRIRNQPPTDLVRLLGDMHPTLAADREDLFLVVDRSTLGESDAELVEALVEAGAVAEVDGTDS